MIQLCRAYPRQSAELRTQRKAVQRLEQGLLFANEATAQLRTENQMLQDRVTALEARVRGTVAA